MRFEVIDCEQHSEAWYAARAGRVTGSRAADMLAKIKSGEAAGRRDYRAQLVVETLTGQTDDETRFFSKDMQRGIEHEPVARGLYEALTGRLVRQTGFLAMTEIRAGCSLDGDVEDFQTLVGIKCPKAATHLEYLKGLRLPPKYVPQATHEMWVTGAEHYDFCSYNERFPEKLQFFLVRIERAEFPLAGHEVEVKRFLAEVDAEVATLRNLKLPWAA